MTIILTINDYHETDLNCDLIEYTAKIPEGKNEGAIKLRATLCDKVSAVTYYVTAETHKRAVFHMSFW